MKNCRTKCCDHHMNKAYHLFVNLVFGVYAILAKQKHLRAANKLAFTVKRAAWRVAQGKQIPEPEFLVHSSYFSMIYYSKFQ